MSVWWWLSRLFIHRGQCVRRSLLCDGCIAASHRGDDLRWWLLQVLLWFRGGKGVKRGRSSKVLRGGTS